MRARLGTRWHMRAGLGTEWHRRVGLGAAWHTMVAWARGPYGVARPAVSAGRPSGFGVLILESPPDSPIRGPAFPAREKEPRHGK